MSLPAPFSSISFADVSGTRFAQTRISMFPRYLPVCQFRQVDGGHFSFHAGYLDGVLDVHHAERARRNDRVGPRVRRHPDSLHSHALVLFRFVEKRQTSAAAAEGAVPAAA